MIVSSLKNSLLDDRNRLSLLSCHDRTCKSTRKTFADTAVWAPHSVPSFSLAMVVDVPAQFM